MQKLSWGRVGGDGDGTAFRPCCRLDICGKREGRKTDQIRKNFGGQLSSKSSKPDHWGVLKSKHLGALTPCHTLEVVHKKLGLSMHSTFNCTPLSKRSEQCIFVIVTCLYNAYYMLGCYLHSVLTPTLCHRDQD